MYEVTLEIEFAAAHFLPGHPTCGQIHGHNYKVYVTLTSENLDESGMVMDFAELKKYIRAFLPDHKFLNDITLLIPTAENLAMLFYRRLKQDLPNPDMLVEVSVYETDRQGATYYE